MAKQALEATAAGERGPRVGRRALIGWAAAVASVPIAGASVAAPSGLWSATYPAKKGALTLMLYRRRAAAPRGGRDRAPVLLLCHGSSFGALTSYDLTVPGGEEYSMMNVFARQGFDVWALDFEGYGRSESGGGNSNIDDSIADLRAAIRALNAKRARRPITSMANLPAHCGRGCSRCWSPIVSGG